MPESSSTWDVLDTAHEALRKVVDDVPAPDWGLPTPCAEWNVTQVLQHAAGDQVAWASAVADVPPPGENPFEPSGKLDEAPDDVVAAALEISARAWATVAKNAGEARTPIPPVPMLPVQTAAAACALDAAVHAWDIAVATGQPSPLSPALAAVLMTAASAVAEPLRGWAYADALEPAAGDDAVAQLLRYLGRDPAWTA
jgi:uncharacterized protein (TIGR03086 family)